MEVVVADIGQELAIAIAELMSVHAECLDRFNTDQPERNAMLGAELITKMRRQREKVAASLDGDPAAHAAHCRALAAGMRVCMRRLEEVE
jgi:hypothetical protein